MTTPPSPTHGVSLGYDAWNQINAARRILGCLHSLLCHVNPESPDLDCLNASDLAAVLELALDQLPKDC